MRGADAESVLNAGDASVNCDNFLAFLGEPDITSVLASPDFAVDFATGTVMLKTF